MQAIALVILNHLDLIERDKADEAALKRSLVANGKFDHKELFPEYFPNKNEVSADPEYDYSNVEWKSPLEAPEMFERLMQSLQDNSRGFMTADQITAEPTWTDWR